MYKKGDVVKGRLSGAIYECMEDEIIGEKVRVRCIKTSSSRTHPVTVGDEYEVPVENIELCILPSATPVQTEKQEINDLIEMRRSLKQFFGC